MAHRYLVRARLSPCLLPYEIEGYPERFGIFTLGQSRNYTRVVKGPVSTTFSGGNYERFMQIQKLHERDAVMAGRLPEIDYDYPMSMDYLDAIIEADGPDEGYAKADDTLELLEALFRLFQPGSIFIRLYRIWEVKEDGTLDSRANWPIMRVKPDPTHLFFRAPNYDLEYPTLSEFTAFFDRHWGIISQKPRPLDVAILRFSSSYEKHTLTDRLIDLMIAMEAMFGSQSEVTYKVALRSSSLIFPPGGARQSAFGAIKKVYNERSRILHGDRIDTLFTLTEVDQFEEYVRGAIKKLLYLWHSGIVLDSEDKLDAYLFFQKSGPQSEGNE